MKLYKLEIDKQRISRMSSEEMLFFFNIGATLFEINTLNKIIFFSSHKDSDKEVVTRAQMAQSFHLLLILCGKLHEAWKTLQKVYFRGGLSRTFQAYLDDDVKESLKIIKRYFSTKNPITTVRNNLAFHNDLKTIKEAINDTPEDEIFEIYLSEAQGNCYYHASTMIIMRAVMKATETDGAGSASSFERFFKDVERITKNMSIFLNFCLRVFPEKMGWPQELIAERIELAATPTIKEVYIPPFVQSD